MVLAALLTQLLTGHAVGAQAAPTEADILKRMQELSEQVDRAQADPARLMKIAQEIQALSAQLEKLQAGQPTRSAPPGSMPPTRAGAPATGGALPAGPLFTPPGEAPLEPGRIAARLELTMTCEAHDLSGEKPSKGGQGTTADFVASGTTHISAAFRESLPQPVIERVPAEALAGWPKLYIPEGTFQWHVKITEKTGSSWTGGYYRPPLGRGVLPGLRKSLGGWTESARTEEHEAHAEWRGEKKTMRALYESPSIILTLTPQLDENNRAVPDTLHFEIDVAVNGTCTTYQSQSGSEGEPRQERESLDSHVAVVIEGAFKQGAASVTITKEDVQWSGLEMIQPPEGEAKIGIKGTLTFEKPKEPGVLAVMPASGLESTGPDQAGGFIPSSKRYVLGNTGKSPIRFIVGATKDWLSVAPAEGELAPGARSEVTLILNEKVKSLPDGLHQDTVSFENTTTGRGSTTRPARVDVGEVQVWQVRLTGQETDDMGGSLMYMKLKDIWKQITVNYGVRFDYDLTAQFQIKKKKGQWVYASGRILKAWISQPSDMFDPKVFFVQKIVCQNCDAIPKLAGTPINGAVHDRSFRLFWPEVVTAAIVHNSLRLQHNSKEESHKGTSMNYFSSAEFLHRASDHELPLKSGVVSTKVIKKSSNDRFRLDKRPPISISYRYRIKRIK